MTVASEEPRAFQARFNALRNQLLLSIRDEQWRKVSDLALWLAPRVKADLAVHWFLEAGGSQDKEFSQKCGEGQALILKDLLDSLRHKKLLAFRTEAGEEEVQVTPLKPDRFEIDAEFENLLPRATDEVKKLEERLLVEEQREPLVVWKGHGKLVDGHTRFRFYALLGRDYQVVEMDFPDRGAVRVLTAKARGPRIEVQAVGLNTKRLWTKLLSPEDVSNSIKVTAAGQLAALSGNPTHFRLAAEAHRIRLAFQYDPHFAVSVSQVDPLPHQMDAVYSHLLTQAMIRFLIADDPGAGKTIMGGLTIKELKFRGLVERILIVTPANLTDQWRREMHDKFGETFTVINRGSVGSVYGRNIWEDHSQCITSIDFVARQDDILNMLRDVRWDLVIVDEAGIWRIARRPG